MGYKGRTGNHPATCESVQRESAASAAQHPKQLPRASKGVVQRDKVGSEVGSKWHWAETMGRALPELKESLMRGTWASCSMTGGHGRTARAGHSGEAPSTSASGVQEHLITKKGEDSKETSVCSEEGKVHLSVVTKQQVRKNHCKTYLDVLWEKGLHLSKKGFYFLSHYFLFLIVE